MKNKQNITRIERQIHLYFDFLLSEYSFTYRKNIYSDFLGFSGPIYVFSFFNKHGCLSFHYIMQKDEIGLYIAKHYSNDQYDLLEREVETAKLCNRRLLTKRQFFSAVSTQLKKEIESKNTVLGIIV